ncbi:hypothetical protein [Pseudomonas sp.]|uniref:hypothetical protein n=1 Tax=Pseudomonas sp. TaxID=306 RepID=UPI003264ECC1
MGISLKEAEGKLTASYYDEVGKQRRCDISELYVLGDNLHRVLKPILNTAGLMRPASIRGHINTLRLLGKALEHLNYYELPKNETGWNSCIAGIYRYILTNPSSNASLKTRSYIIWGKIRFQLLILVESGIIPSAVHIPQSRESLNTLDTSYYQDYLLGQSPMRPVHASTPAEKLICEISLARTDAAYLDELREILSVRAHTLRECLTDHWKKIKENMEFGKRLIDSINWEELKPKIISYNNKLSSEHPAYPNTITGLANYLSTLCHAYDRCPPSDNDFNSNETLQKQFRYVPLQKTFGSFERISKKIDAPSAHFDVKNWPNRNILLWWLGRINHLDTALIAALLIMLHPSWPPQALLLAKISNRNNKYYIELPGSDVNFEIDKPRAKSMKRERLTPLSHEIISTLIEFSTPLRTHLKKCNAPHCDFLFIPYVSQRNKYGTANSTVSSAYISGSWTRNRKHSAWVGSLYPDLAEVGLIPKTLSFKKIRNTEGVLEWFKTKSLRAVARKLGNTEKVVIDHYIPKAIITAWNTRMIRRFQNLWIAVATANETFMLDVTDFGDMAELHAFLRDMLELHHPGDSPLAEALHKNFCVFTDNEEYKSHHEANLHIAISRPALSTLYAYQAAAIESGLSSKDLDVQDSETGLSPSHFISLADLLQSQLPLDRNPEYVACHEHALKFSENQINREKFSHLLPQHLPGSHSAPC